MHEPFEHIEPDAVHVVPQQGWPIAPHATHVVPAHVTPDAVHELPLQHAWLRPPHAVHALPVHTCAPLAHDEPWLTHAAIARLVSQQPVVQTAPGQHGCEGVPHPMHWPPLQTWLPVHPLPLPLHVCDATSQHKDAPHELPAQHAWFEPPHVTHVPFEHALPAAHWLLVQHGSFVAPHVTQLPPLQTPLVHALFAQHC
jgi:hypothetical protein